MCLKVKFSVILLFIGLFLYRYYARTVKWDEARLFHFAAVGRWQLLKKIPSDTSTPYSVLTCPYQLSTKTYYESQWK